MTNMYYSAYMGMPITITLCTGEKVHGEITSCVDKHDYISIDRGASEKRIAKSQIAMIEKRNVAKVGI
jgi:hypothetical protein